MSSPQPWARWPASETLRLAQWVKRGGLRPTAPGLAQALTDADFPETLALAQALQGLGEQMASAKAVALLLQAVAEAQLHAEQKAQEALRWVLTGGGPQGNPGPWARRTDAALAELLGSAKQRVWVTSYARDPGEAPLAALARRCLEAPGLKVRVGVHVNREGQDARPTEALLNEAARRFWRHEWPAEAPEVQLFAWAAAFKAEPRERGSLHAKLVLVDGERALVGSANLTERALGRNLEAGALLRDPARVQELMDWLDEAVAQGHLVPLPGRVEA